jgi:hypothetical protein
MGRQSTLRALANLPLLSQVRDIEMVNPDSGVLINWQAGAITVTGIKIRYEKTRANNIPNKFHQPTNADGHWGLMYGELTVYSFCLQSV